MLALVVTAPVCWVAFVCLFYPREVQSYLVEDYKSRKRNFPTFHFLFERFVKVEMLEDESFLTKIKGAGILVLSGEIFLVITMINWR